MQIMKKYFKQKEKNGYTIIETIIAISIFIVIVMLGIGSLLNANLLHQKSRDMRSIMDTLNFLMEDMSRNIRLGYHYHCIDGGNITSTTPHSCPSGGGGISFRSALGGQWVYYGGPGADGKVKVFKSIDGGATSVQITPDEVVIDAALSGMAIVGAEPPPGNKEQPFVTIRIAGKITFKGKDTPFSLQTSVSQRLIDIGN